MMFGAHRPGITSLRGVLRFCVACLCLPLFACSQDSVEYDGDRMILSFMAPAALGDPLIAGLRAQLILDGQRVVELSVSDIDNSISGRMDNVAPGDHVLIVRYFIVLADTDLLLATVVTDVTVADGQISEIILTDNDLNRDYDADIDGFSNLVEVRSGTDPLDSSSFPAALQTAVL